MDCTCGGRVDLNEHEVQRTHDHDEEICRHRGAWVSQTAAQAPCPGPQPFQHQHPLLLSPLGSSGAPATHTDIQAPSLPTQVVPGVQKIREAQSNDFEHSFHHVDGEEDVVQGREVPLCEDTGWGGRREPSLRPTPAPSSPALASSSSLEPHLQAAI